VIDWSQLVATLATRLGRSRTDIQTSLLAGGDINQAFRLDCGAELQCRQTASDEELFGNPGLRFFDAYREHFSFDGGYSARREPYNLYHLLNHANFFGGAYVTQAQQVTRRLLAQLY
jgi:fructosamine-3-kinase